MTNCVDQTVPDVGESDLGPHYFPVCLYAADNFSRCGNTMYVSSTYADPGIFAKVGGGGDGGPGRKKAPLPGKKL